MQIVEIHVYSVELPLLGHPYKFAGTELTHLQTTVVKLIDSDGVVGWGEACPLGATYQPEHALGVQAAIQHLAPHLLGHASRSPAVLSRSMNQLMNGHNSAKAAIEIAAYDLTAKFYNTRVCDLLGGAATTCVPSYYAVGLLEPDETARVAAAKVGEGYKRLQLKIGGRELEEDIAAIMKTYEAIQGQATLVVDANRSLTTRDAILLSLRCRDVPLCIEQPCNSLMEIRTVRQQIQHPVFLDESLVDIHTVVQAAANGECDGMGGKVTRLGGLNPFTTLRDICEPRALPITCDDTFGGDIIAAACVHGGATVAPHLLEGVWTASPYILGNYGEPGQIQIENGTIEVPTQAGLGITPNEAGMGAAIQSYSL